MADQPLVVFRRFGSRGSHSCASVIKNIQTEDTARMRSKKKHSPWYTNGHVYTDKLAKQGGKNFGEPQE